jgi:homoserine kinase
MSVEMPPEMRSALPVENVEKRLTIRVPGSTANLGPGFDTLGLALKVHSWLDFSVLSSGAGNLPLFRQCGKIAQQLPSDKSNLIYKILEKSIRNKTLLERIRISVYSDIPLERGMGSSGSVIIGTIYAAALLNGSKPVAEEMLRQAAEFESHIDNLSASLMGGLVVSHKSDHELIVDKIEWPANWRLLVVVPSYSVSTQKSRSVLPESYKQSDVVENLQRLALLTGAICKKDAQLFKRALHDKIHEPYRLSLIPELGELRELLKDEPVLGSALSGAGSAMLVVVEQEHSAGIFKLLTKWASSHAKEIKIIEADVDTAGLTVISN